MSPKDYVKFILDWGSSFREDFHFLDLKDRVLPMFANSGNKIQMYCSASSTGEEPYSMAMSVFEAKEELNILYKQQ